MANIMAGWRVTGGNYRYKKKGSGKNTWNYICVIFLASYSKKKKKIVLTVVDTNYYEGRHNSLVKKIPAANQLSY